MIGSKIPRYLVLLLTLGVAVGVIIFALFFAQYRWLANELVSASVAEHQVLLESSFERRKRAALHAAADDLAAELDPQDRDSLLYLLENRLAADSSLLGLRFASADMVIDAGRSPDGIADGDAALLADALLIVYPVVREQMTLGTLTAAFRLDELRAESAAFEERVVAKEMRSRNFRSAWVAAGMLLILGTIGIFIWMLIREQNERIRALRIEAEKLREADFGEPLPQHRRDELGELAAVFNKMRDELRTTTLSRDYVDSILAGMNEAVIVTSNDGIIKRVNRATSLLVGYDESELLGESIDSLIDNRKTASLLGSTVTGVPRETMLLSKFGDRVPVSYTCSIVDADDNDGGDRVYAAQNITERRRAEQRIRYLARIDALTKVPNRMQFQHLLQREIARARRTGQPLCLFYVDIDHFKEINDTFGHLAGDATLETVATRLALALPEKSVIGRLAGDEFAVIIKNVEINPADRTATDELAQSLLDRLADPFSVQGHEVFMTASLGVAFYPGDAANVIDLIRNADAALYSAKKAGGNVFAYYRSEMNEAAVERLMTKSKLKRSFERDELLVHYQPKYNLETGEVFGAEALVRWELPDRGMILPADFIPLAEETNLIIEIGEWVLDKVCEDFRIWQRSVSSPGRVSVNLSLRQLRQPNFIGRINSILRSHEVSPTSLELEITETTLMENPERTIRILDQLYALGLHLAIDDFGTGYSSLSALQQFPISTLKIDQSFVRDVATDADDATIVDTIIQMGRNLHMDVVAEGVETEEQLAFLQKLSCTYVQGMLFGDPMSADNYLELLLAQVEGTDSHRALFA